MAKAKFNAKEFLLKRGEWLITGVFGFICLMLLIWGTQAGSANPVPAITQIQNDAKAVQKAIADPTKPDSSKVPEFTPQPWLLGDFQVKSVPPAAFQQGKHPMFDPVASPSTKRENPNVLSISDYQVDLVRSAMLGYDVILDGQGNPLIAVLTTTNKKELDQAKLKKTAQLLEEIAKRKAGVQPKVNRPQPVVPKNPMMPVAIPGMNPGMIPGMNPHGLANNQLNQNSKRTETVIKYVPLSEVETAVNAGNLPAFTVIPLRMVTVHAVVPYKKQLDEFKRALRLPNPPSNAKKEDIEKSDAEAKVWGPWYDGFEVQRRVTKISPTGELEVIEEWPDIKDPEDISGNYLFEEEYIDKIDTKKIADHLDEGHIPYFLKPDLMLAMPLPQLAKDLGVKYPEIKMKDIVENIDRLKRANHKEVAPSELLQRLDKARPRSSIYKTKTAEAVEGIGYDPKQFGTVAPGKGAAIPPPPVPAVIGPRPGMLGVPKAPDGFDANASVRVEDGVDNFLLRFVDCNVKPGYTYEYRIRLRMVNPNFGQPDLVAVPEYAKEKYKILRSNWLQLQTPITVPAESYLYAQDVKAYRDQINTAYPTSSPNTTDEVKIANNYLNKLLQVRDDQAVVQLATWMAHVQAGDNTKGEPIGGWVMAEMPVSRGEYIGRRQIVRLPLWSSETQQYVFREITDRVVKGKFQPKGWMVDFSTQSILVDFEGGKVKTKSSVRFDEKGNLISGSRSFEEEVATEMLIVRPDGKLVVRSSQQDKDDPIRTEILTRWGDWLKEVEKHKTPGAATEPNPYDPKPKN